VVHHPPSVPSADISSPPRYACLDSCQEGLSYWRCPRVNIGSGPHAFSFPSSARRYIFLRLAMLASISVKIDQVVDDVKSQCRIRASCFLVFIQRPSKHLRIGNSGTHQLLVRLLTSLLAPKHASKTCFMRRVWTHVIRSMAYSIVCMLHTCFIAHANLLNRKHPSWLNVKLPT